MRYRRELLPLLLCCVAVGTELRAFCHAPFSSFVERHFFISFSFEYIDLEVVLYFHHEEARAIRRAIDLDGDGRLSPHEFERCRERMEFWSENLFAWFGEIPIEWVHLHPALIDTHGVNGVNSSLVEARLYLFAPMPNDCDSGLLRLEDRLFSDANALITWEIETRDGVDALMKTPGNEVVDSTFVLASPRLQGASREIEISFIGKSNCLGGDGT